MVDNICDYNNRMQIEYDPDKDAINRSKHGISLAQAVHLDWNTAQIEEDARFVYGEMRMAGLGLIGADVFHVVFVEREEVIRVISLRPATKQEFKRYVLRHFEGW